MTKLAIKLENQKPVLSIAHMASSTPFYCVEEVEIDNRNVSVSFFNENDPESDIENTTIPTRDLIDFTNEFYAAYEDKWDPINCIHYQDRTDKAGIEYLRDNLNSVVTDYLNAKGVNNA